MQCNVRIELKKLAQKIGGKMSTISLERKIKKIENHIFNATGSACIRAEDAVSSCLFGITLKNVIIQEPAVSRSFSLNIGKSSIINSLYSQNKPKILEHR